MKNNFRFYFHFLLLSRYPGYDSSQALSPFYRHHFFLVFFPPMPLWHPPSPQRLHCCAAVGKSRSFSYASLHLQRATQCPAHTTGSTSVSERSSQFQICTFIFYIQIHLPSYWLAIFLPLSSYSLNPRIWQAKRIQVDI